MRKVFTLLLLYHLSFQQLDAQCNPDIAAPLVVAISPLSVNIMPTKLITLWATDFIQSAQDNCTAQNDIQFAVRDAGMGGSGFPTDANGNPNPSVSFNCDQLGTQLVEVWARDAAGNAAMDSAYVIVQNNFSICIEEPFMISGCAKTDQNQYVGETIWHFSSLDTAGGTPTPPKSTTGPCLQIVPIFAPQIIVTPKSTNTSYLNGVSTFDLVLINKHILALESLNSPFKLLAADANNSRTVTTFDIVELRKLILGIYTKLPNNDSWRYVRKSYVFPNLANPFQPAVPVADTFTIFNLMNQSFDFVGYKVGDVNGNAIPDFTNEVSQSRASLPLVIDNALLRPGETTRIPVRLGKAEILLGMQFALQFDPKELNIQRVIPGPKIAASTRASFDQFYALPERGLLTFSWDNPIALTSDAGEVTFYVEITAIQAIELSKAFRLLPERLQPEAYLQTGVSDLEEVDLLLEFSTSTPPQKTEIFPVSPNPSTGQVYISMTLAEQTPVSVEVFELNGQSVFAATQACNPGFQQIEIPEAALAGPARILAYRLQVGSLNVYGKIGYQPAH